MSIRNGILLVTICLLIAVLSAACSGTPTPTEEEDMAENIYLISGGTQLVLEDGLRIAAGNFDDGEYTDEDGNTIQGRTAMLWIREGDAAFEQRVRVHEGQEITLERYTLRVVELGWAEHGEFVRLAVIPNE